LVERLKQKERNEHARDGGGYIKWEARSDMRKSWTGMFGLFGETALLEIKWSY